MGMENNKEIGAQAPSARFITILTTCIMVSMTTWHHSKELIIVLYKWIFFSLYKIDRTFLDYKSRETTFSSLSTSAPPSETSHCARTAAVALHKLQIPVSRTDCFFLLSIRIQETATNAEVQVKDQNLTELHLSHLFWITLFIVFVDVSCFHRIWLLSLS